MFCLRKFNLMLETGLPPHPFSLLHVTRFQHRSGRVSNESLQQQGVGVGRGGGARGWRVVFTNRPALPDRSCNFISEKNYVGFGTS
jgi:hypothetical protein